MNNSSSTRSRRRHSCGIRCNGHMTGDVTFKGASGSANSGARLHNDRRGWLNCDCAIGWRWLLNGIVLRRQHRFSSFGSQRIYVQQLNTKEQTTTCLETNYKIRFNWNFLICQTNVTNSDHESDVSSFQSQVETLHRWSLFLFLITSREIN